MFIETFNIIFRLSFRMIEYKKGCRSVCLKECFILYVCVMLFILVSECKTVTCYVILTCPIYCAI